MIRLRPSLYHRRINAFIYTIGISTKIIITFLLYSFLVSQIFFISNTILCFNFKTIHYTIVFSVNLCRLKTILDPWTNFVYVLQLLKHNILDLNKHKYGPFLSLNLVNFKMDPWHMPCLPPPRAGTALNAEEPTQIPLLFT